MRILAKDSYSNFNVKLYLIINTISATFNYGIKYIKSWKGNKPLISLNYVSHLVTLIWNTVGKVSTYSIKQYNVTLFIFALTAKKWI